MTWQLWDKHSSINGLSAEDFMAKNKHLVGETEILIRFSGNQVVQVEGKQILSNIYGIDNSLEIDEFIQEYQNKLTATTNETPEEFFDPYDIR